MKKKYRSPDNDLLNRASEDVNEMLNQAIEHLGNRYTVKTDQSPWIVRIKGKRFKASSGKTSWPHSGAAMNSLHNTFRYWNSDTMRSVRDDGRLSWSDRDRINKEIVYRLIEDGVVEITQE